MTIGRTMIVVLGAISVWGCSTAKPIAIDRTSVDGRAQLAEFAAMDTDGDGKVSLDQTTKYHETLFSQNDKNGDGVLEASEIPQLIVPPNSTREKVVARLDRDGNGKLVAREFVIRVNTLYARDQNADGTLTADEFLTVPMRAKRASKPSSSSGNAPDVLENPGKY